MKDDVNYIIKHIDCLERRLFQHFRERENDLNSKIEFLEARIENLEKTQIAVTFEMDRLRG